MSDLPRTARLYLVTLTALALGAVFYSATALGADTQAWVTVALLALAIGIFDAFPIKLMQHVEVTVSDTIKFAAVLLSPMPAVIVGTCLGTLLYEARVKRAWFKKLFNTSEMTLAWAAAAGVYGTIHQPQVDYFGSPHNVAAIVLAGLTAFLVNSFLLTLVISLATRRPFVNIWAWNIPQVIWQDLSMLSLGVFLAILWRYNLLAVLLAGLPLTIVRHSYLIAQRLQQQTHEALEALMVVVDERDQHTYDHSQRVSDYARAIAEELDLRQEDVEIIASAGLLHDLGKVGMADDILFNPKLLTSTERKNAERHAVVGAMLLSKFPLFEKGALLVRHHHERYDGKGYPDGLKGEAIPIGARIIAVADSYQAMTEERPYRHALAHDAAITQLLLCSGDQFDPRVVQAFLRTLPPVADKVSLAARGGQPAKPESGEDTMVILLVLALSLGVALVRGGRLDSLGRLNLRWPGLFVAGFMVQVLIFADVWQRNDTLAALTPAAYVFSLALLLVVMAANLRVPGFWIIAIGFCLNFSVIALNGGHMPSAAAARTAAGRVPLAPGQTISNSVGLSPDTPLWFLADIFAIPRPFILANVFSAGDVLIALGLFYLIQKAMVRPAPPSALHPPETT